MIDRVKSAVDAGRIDFFIIARTDALASGFDRMVERAVACVESGRRHIPRGGDRPQMYKRVVDAVKVPVLANITEFGKTPPRSRSCARPDRDRALPLRRSAPPTRCAQCVLSCAARETRRLRAAETRETLPVPGYTTTSASWTRFREDKVMTTMTAAARNLSQAEKSVALSGVPASTALCTVGRTGNDLHYRGYDILDLADRIRGSRLPPRARKLPNRRSSRRTRQAAVASGHPDGRAGHSRIDPGFDAPDGRAADSLLCDGRGAARRRGPQARRGARQPTA